MKKGLAIAARAALVSTQALSWGKDGQQTVGYIAAQVIAGSRATIRSD